MGLVFLSLKSASLNFSLLTDFDLLCTYDLNSNRTSIIDPAGVSTYTYDALNRFTSITKNEDLKTFYSH